MATIYVDSNASGAGDGTSWTDAYTSLDGAVSAESPGESDVLAVAYNHDERDANNVSLSTSALIISLDPADDSYRRGAKYGTTTGGNYDFSLTIRHAIGIDWYDEDDWAIHPRNNSYSIFEDCGFIHTAGGAGPSFDIGNATDIGTFIFRECTFNALNYGCGSEGGRHEYYNCSFDGCRPNGNIDILMIGCSFVNVSNVISAQNRGQAFIRHCKLESGDVIFSSSVTTSGLVQSEYISTSTISDTPFGLHERHMYAGTVKTVTSRYRTGGADDGRQANAYSWEMASNSNADICNPLTTPNITKWVDGGSSITFTIYIASGGTLQDADFWIELFGPDDAGSTTTQYYHENTQKNPYETASNLTTDSSSTWNGTGVGTKQQIDITYTPQVAGPVYVTCFLVKTSTTIYVDPQIVTS